MEKCTKNAVILQTAYFFIFWITAITADIMTEVYGASEDLFWSTIFVPVIYAIAFAAFEKKLCCGKRRKFHIAFIISFLAAAPLSIAVVFICCGPLADYYRSIKDYGYFMGGLAESFEGIQFGIYAFFKLAGFAAGYLFFGIKSFVRFIIKKISE